MIKEKMKKKVLFISAANNVHTVKWVNALCDKYEVHLVTCKNHNVTVNKVDESVKVHLLRYSSPIGYYTNAIELNRIFKKIRPDIVNVHYASGYGTLARIANVKPILLSVWGSDLYEFPKRNKINEKILKMNLNNAYAIASTSKNMKEEVERLIPNIKSEIHIIPFGVDMNKFKRIQKNESDEKEFRIGLVKGLEEKYGVSDLIVAFSKVLQKVKAQKYKKTKITLYIYGEGSQRKKLEDLIQKLDLQESVFLKGKIKNDLVPNVLNGFDLFCVTSKLESFGVSVVEAMACGVPVIASAADGFKEIIDNNRTGIIVPIGDTEKIATAIIEMMNNKEKREKIAQNALLEVNAKYNINDNIESMITLYDNIIVKNKK